MHMFVHSWRSIKNQNQPWKQVPTYLEELSLALMLEDFDILILAIHPNNTMGLRYMSVSESQLATQWVLYNEPIAP